MLPCRGRFVTKPISASPLPREPFPRAVPLLAPHRPSNCRKERLPCTVQLWAKVGLFSKYSRLNEDSELIRMDRMPPCSRLSRSGLEALEQAVPSECRPSLTAARHDGGGLSSRKASMGTLTYLVLTEIYAAICAPFQDWPSRNTA